MEATRGLWERGGARLLMSIEVLSIRAESIFSWQGLNT